MELKKRRIRVVWGDENMDCILEHFKKDINNYYLKPPNISWGIIFPLSWTLMQIIRSSGGLNLSKSGNTSGTYGHEHIIRHHLHAGCYHYL